MGRIACGTKSFICKAAKEINIIGSHRVILGSSSATSAQMIHWRKLVRSSECAPYIFLDRSALVANFRYGYTK